MRPYGRVGSPYAFGLLIGLVGTAVFGVFLARSRAVPAWVGWVITIGVLGFFVSPQQGKAAVIGLAWIAVGFRLVTVPSTTLPTD